MTKVQMHNLQQYRPHLATVHAQLHCIRSTRTLLYVYRTVSMQCGCVRQEIAVSEYVEY